MSCDVFQNPRNFKISGRACQDKGLIVFETINLDIAPVDKDYCIILTKEEIIRHAHHMDLSESDRSITQFMEIVFNQLAIMNPKEHAIFENGKTYLSHPWLFGFNERDCPEVGDGKRLFPGTQKSVHFIEGPKGRGYVCPALVIDAKKAAFHEEFSLIEKAQRMVNDDFSCKVSEIVLERLNAGLKGLYFYTRHTDDERDHQIHAIVSHTAADTTFELQDGTRMSVLQYFKEKYGIKLEYPNAPLVKVREGGRFNNYPMELGTLRPMQRVSIAQQTPLQSQKTTKNCAIPPLERQNNIKKGAHALKLFGSDGNQFVANAGLYIYKEPMKITGRRLPPPNIRYYEGTAVVQDGKWRTTQGHFFMPARCEIWAIYAIVMRNERSRFNESLLRDFAKMFEAEASSRGMRMPPPTEIAVTSDDAELKSCLKTAAFHNCKYCLIVSADSITSVHKKLKLWERELEMVTQDLRLSTVEKVVRERRRVTLENIILKANVKLGGLNYMVDLNGVIGSSDAQRWLRPGRLFLGIAVNFSQQLDKSDNPAVVGYASNYKNHSVEFVGDYLFQSSGREETIDTMSVIVSNIMPKFAENHDGKYPRDLIIYRSGVADGSFKSLVSHEIPLLRGTLSTLGVKDINIIFIVVQKRHNVRLMLSHIDKSLRVTEQNIPPGVVVDSNVTRPAFKEFYLNSHTTLQGSASTPRYTVLVDDLNLSMNELEGMTHVLTYAHQIVNLSTSLPTPLYVANTYAERGRNNYGAYMACSNSASSESGGSLDCGRLAQRLSYKNTKLEDFRVNA
ncbi:hypothetical protein KIN20_028702 [Parelaphostrongylus tenuis]|uniref:Piwi domain-containing protein n=1 Tax=Parelaphostrongylus tenuis TaxID=148309 RepID=A0AAD5WEX0_PARTN|nr:hypothetical protein KIN20_028702 [Parelaphostrongylus tenuis]